MICALKLDPMYNERPDKICWNLDESKKMQFQETIQEKMKVWNEMYLQYKDDKDNLDNLV